MADPYFVGASDRNFYLRSDSPCIDAGNPKSSYDPDGSRSDIGAHFFLNIPIVINEINYNSSNEFTPEDWVELYNPLGLRADISDWVFKNEDEAHAFGFRGFMNHRSFFRR